MIATGLPPLVDFCSLCAVQLPVKTGIGDPRQIADPASSDRHPGCGQYAAPQHEPERVCTVFAQAIEFPAVPPSVALAAVEAYEQSAIVDLDETLYLRNSTEDFLDSAQPGVIGG